MFSSIPGNPISSFIPLLRNDDAASGGVSYEKSILLKIKGLREKIVTRAFAHVVSSGHDVAIVSTSVLLPGEANRQEVGYVR